MKKILLVLLAMFAFTTNAFAVPVTKIKDSSIYIELFNYKININK